MRVLKQKNGSELHLLEKGETANPNGRPPRQILVKHVLADLKEKGYEPVKASDVVAVYEAMLNISEAKIIEIVNNKELPYFIRIIASAMTTKGKGFEIIERLINRSHGMPRLSADLTSGGEKLSGLNITVADKETGDVLRKLLEGNDKGK